MIDTETNKTDLYHQRYLMGIAFWTDERGFYIPVKHDSWMAPDALNLSPPSDFLKCIQTEWVAHNAKFDIHVLKRAGFELPDTPFYDTLLMAHLIDENKLSYDLDARAGEELGIHKEKDLARIMKAADWDSMPAFAMEKYAIQDAYAEYQLYYHYKPLFEKYEEVWKVDREFLLVLQQLEERGLVLDKNEADRLRQLCELQMQEMQKEFGFDPNKTSQLHKALFDAPPNGLGLKVRTRTPKTGKPQVNTAFLEATNHPICGRLLQYAETKKQLTSYYRPYLKLTGENYDRIHAGFKQHGTVTGRLSCADPNMQQIPRESPIKALFKADHGKQLWEIDYKNIELRLAAVYSEEQQLLDIFRAERDVHGETAETLGISRPAAKVINFLITYGGGKPALSSKLGVSLQEAGRFYDSYRDNFKDIFRFMDECQYVAEETGSIRLWSGRERHFFFKSECRKAFNSLIQGGAFEIVKRSMNKLHKEGFDLRNQVHDSVWLMVDSKTEVDAAEKIMAEWTTEAFGLTFSVESKQLN